eukprot:COSAG02_NODE_547_length_20492_cov_265.508802_8_plen_60_part_00
MLSSCHCHANTTCQPYTYCPRGDYCTYLSMVMLLARRRSRRVRDAGSGLDRSAEACPRI